MLKGYKGGGTLNRAWLRERLVQVQWKTEHCPDEDIATKEEDELLDMLHADCERRDRFLRELNAPDNEIEQLGRASRPEVIYSTPRARWLVCGSLVGAVSPL